MDDDYLLAKYDGMDRGATALEQVAKTMEREVTELQKRLRAIEWDSNSQQEFEVLMRRWNQAYLNLVSIVHRGGGTVRDVSGMYQDVENWGTHAFQA